MYEGKEEDKYEDEDKDDNKNNFFLLYYNPQNGAQVGNVYFGGRHQK